MEGSALNIYKVDSIDKEGKKSIGEEMNTYLYTKLITPNLPSEYVERQDLLEKFGSVLSKKLTVISAPAGYGKTTLLSSWVRNAHAKSKIAWVSLDNRDNNPHLFWNYIYISIQNAVNSSEIMNAASITPLHRLTFNHFLALLINLMDKVSDDLILVMDDFHVISDVGICESFQYFLKHIPSKLHVVVSSRKDMPIALAKMRAKDELQVITSDELRLSTEEIRYYLNNIMGILCDEDKLVRIEEITEGWIVALKLIALNARLKPMKSNDSTDLLNEYLIDYLTEEILQAQPEEMQNFIIKTSFLNTINSSICNALLGINNSQYILELLEKNNTFIQSVDSDKRCFKYHQLFSIYLRKKLNNFNPSIVKDLYLKASKWYESNELLFDSMETSIKSEDYLNTKRLIEKYCDYMIVNWDCEKLICTIETLPEEVVTKMPMLSLLYAVGVICCRGKIENDISFKNSIIDFESELFAEYSGEIYAINSLISFYDGNIDKVFELSKMALSKLDEKSVFYYISLSKLLDSYIIRGDSDNAEKCIGALIKFIKGTNYLDNIIPEFYYTNSLAYLKYKKGAFKDCKRIIKRLLSAETFKNSIIPATDLGYLLLSNLEYEFNEIADSLMNIKKSIYLAEMILDTTTLIQDYVLLAKIYAAENRVDEALLLIDRIDELCLKCKKHFLMSQIVSDLVRVLALIGNTQRMEDIFKEYNIAVKSEIKIEDDETIIAIADMLLTLGKSDEAMTLIQTLYELIERTDRSWTIVRVLLLKSIAASNLNKVEFSMELLERALIIAQNEGYIRTFIDYGDNAKQLLTRYIEYEDSASGEYCKAKEYAEMLISLYGNSADYTRIIRSDRLSIREKEVLKAIGSGYTNKEIAAKCYIAESTVKKHINSIYKKLGIRKRTHVFEVANEIKKTGLNKIRR